MVPFAAVLVLAAAPARAGTVLHYKVGEKGRAEISIAQDAVRIEHDGKHGPTWLVYDRKASKALIGEPGKKVCTEVTRKDLAAMKDKLAGAPDVGAQMEEAMAGMSAEERAMMAKMMPKGMGAALPGAPAAEPVVYAKKKAEKVGKWKAVRWVGTRGKAPVAEFWTVPYGEAGLGAEEVQLLKDMNDFMGQFRSAAGAARLGRDPSEFFGQDRGLPVKYRFTEEPDMASELQSVDSRKLGAALFRVPKDYEKRSLAEAMR